MGLRWWEYQQPLSWWSRLHVLLGIGAYLVFMAKFCSSRKWYLTPKSLRPIGFALATIFPLTAFGLALPFLEQSSSWVKLTVPEITRNPQQDSFDRNCCICHSREQAVDGLGMRENNEWIAITEPMAWAGALEREATRGAMAALLTPSPKSAGPLTNDPIDRHCLGCHDRSRVLQAKKDPAAWRQTVLRMQAYAQKQPQGPQITNEQAEEVLLVLGTNAHKSASEPVTP